MLKSYPLEIEQLTYAYDSHVVLNRIDLMLLPGEFLSILGTSGCGKSTLLRAIAGLVRPSSGSITIAGLEVIKDSYEKIPAEKRQVGFVFQDYALFPFLTVRQNIGFGLTTSRKMPKRIIDERVNELLNLIGMQQYADRFPSDLSGGQQQRVAVARALAPKPKLLLLDEPFANVDTMHRQMLAEKLQILVKHEHVSVMLVTHDRNEALALADRVAVFEQQKQGTILAQCDTPEQVYHCPKNRVVASSTGLVSLIAGEARGKIAETVLGNIPLTVEAAGAGWVVARPEMASFMPDSEGNAEIIARSFNGRCYRLACQTVLGEVLVEWQGIKPPEFGQRGKLQFHQPCWFVKQ